MLQTRKMNISKAIIVVLYLNANFLSPCPFFAQPYIDTFAKKRGTVILQLSGPK